jgi:hypothetical protein
MPISAPGDRQLVVTDQIGAHAMSNRFRLGRPDLSHRNNAYPDSGWWPASIDLSAPIVQLLPDIDEAGFRVRRVLYNLEDGWARPPRRAAVDGREIRFSGYHLQPKSVITLIDDGGSRRLEIAIVPPDTEAAVADRALRIAGLDGDSRGRDILAAAGG